MNDWHCLVGGQRYGPVSKEELQSWVLVGRVRPSDLVWTEGMTDWLPVAQVAELRPATQPGATPPPPGPLPAAQAHSEVYSKKVAAGILGIVLGSLGIHKFYLGYNTAGIIMLLISILTCGVGAPVMSVIGIIEGVVYLTMPDGQFEQTYVLGRKEWF